MNAHRFTRSALWSAACGTAPQMTDAVDAVAEGALGECTASARDRRLRARGGRHR